MLLQVAPQTMLERIALWLGLVPMPLLHTQGASMVAKAVLAAANAGVFEALKNQALTVQTLAEKSNLDATALDRLLPVLQSLGYLTYNDKAGYTLTRIARRFCLEGSPHSILPHLRFYDEVCWPALASMGDYLATGKGRHFHTDMPQAGWQLYQAGMASLARQVAPMAMGGVRLPTNATRLLDIAGAHGLFSAQLLQRYPALQADILELPQAAEASAKAWQGHALQPRIRYIAADALTYAYPANAYDAVLISGLLHHLSPSDSQAIVVSAAQTLKKGGGLIVQEFVKPGNAKRPDLGAAVSNLFFALTSGAQNYAAADYEAFITNASLKVKSKKALYAMPACWQWMAVKL